MDTALISLQELAKSDEAWFYKEFVHGFMTMYKDRTFIITEAGKPKLLGPIHIQEKEKWLLETAKEEFNDYVVDKKENYKALKIIFDHESMGIIFYRLEQDKEEIIYLTQLFVLPAFQKKGVSAYLITEMLPKLHPNFKRYEVLTRHQNDGAMLLYNKLGFNIGDRLLVEKYGYNPLYYVGFYKVI
jgi:GNAT superfamily N-acetyltransferase